MVNHVIQVELIDVAGIELVEAGADVLEQRSQLALVIGGDPLRCCTTLGVLR
jgi:hypothetical protein